jgi:hypothetical protein
MRFNLFIEMFIYPICFGRITSSYKRNIYVIYYNFTL